MRYPFCFALLIILFSEKAFYAQNSYNSELDSIYALQAVHYKAKEYSKIIDLSHYAKNIKLKNSADSISMARVTAYIGYANNKFNKFHESIDGFKDALKYIPSNDSDGVVKSHYYILYDLMTRYYSLRRYKKALSVIEKAEDLLNQNDFFSDDYYFQVHQRKFRIYSSLGYYDKANIEVEKIKQVLLSSENLNEEKLRYGWMRYYRTSLLAHYYEALYIKNKRSDYKSILEQTTPKIVEYIKKLDSIYENTETLKNPKSTRQVWNLSYYVGALYYTSDYYKVTGDYKTALGYIEKAIDLSKVANEPVRNITEYLRFKANMLANLGNTKTAFILIEEIKKNFEPNNYNISDLYVFKGDVYAKNKKLDSTLYYYHKAISYMHNSDEKLKENFSNFSSRYQFPSDSKQMDHMSFMLSKYFKDNEKASEASKNLNHLAYTEFLEGHENLDLSLGNKQLFYKILEKKIYLNKDNFGSKPKFISNIENISNSLAWKKFSESRSIIHLPIIDSIEGIEYEIRKQLVSAKKERELKQEDSLKKLLKIHQNKIAKNYSTISYHTQNNFDIIGFQKLLDDDQVVLKYLFFLDQFAVIQISNNAISLDLKPWGEKEKKLVADHLNYLKKPGNSYSFKEELTQLLISKNALEFNSIIIIPDTPVYNLPFETLWHKNNYLIHEKTIHYSSHLRFLFSNNDKNVVDAEATIFAPNYPKGETSYVTRSAPVFLEGAQKEAKALKDIFSSNLFIGNTATKDNFVNHKADGNILHLAMHASIDADDPVLSNFNFSNNERLYLEELYALKIPSELAVLSACNTGVGKTDDVSGMASFQRAFNYAGTKATIASLWEVPDESTSQIMISFYKYLKKGEKKSSALQKAKLEYLNKTNITKLEHPYYWAGFVLYGDDLPVKTTNNNIIIIILFGILFILFLVILRTRRNKI